MATEHIQAIVLCDVDGLISYWSPGAEQLFGYPATAAIGQSLNLIVPEALRERHWAGFKHAVESGRASSSGAATNFPVKCQDGQVRTFPARFAFLTDAHGKPAGAIGIYNDRQGDERPFGPVQPLSAG
ncbi:MAG: PAS domain-containing protein [Deltaproteobacteria bacterium]|nr:PAS domain-containing protein [Deltaproteobacteria bacterium]